MVKKKPAVRRSSRVAKKNRERGAESGISDGVQSAIDSKSAELKIKKQREEIDAKEKAVEDGGMVEIEAVKNSLLGSRRLLKRVLLFWRQREKPRRAVTKT